MSWPSLLQYGAFLLIVTLLVRPAGAYLARVFARERTLLDPVLLPVERLVHGLAGIDANREMSWKQYALAFVRFGLLSTVFLYLLLRVQDVLPWFWADQQQTELTWDLSLNTAVSFATTTTWQAYAGEDTMSYLTQMAGLSAQNFLAGASGLAVGIAFIRGLVRREADTLGNFWVDVIRATLWVLLPLSCLGCLFLVWQGVPLNLDAYTVVETIGGGQQVIAQGPVATLEVIKNFGTNGGGFFNANGAHPFEAPTPLANLFHMLAIAVLPAALTHTFGRMAGNARQGWTVYAAMLGLFALGLVITGWAEQEGTGQLETAGAEVETSVAGAPAPGGNMEGKEVRFGIGGSVLAATTTSNGATGSYNSMHDSYSPLGGLVPLVNMLLGEVIFGGLGTGLSGFIMIALVAVFISGLMIGRTPEYLGKRIGPVETRLVILYALLAPFVVLSLTALAVSTGDGLAGLTINQGAHGLTEILYAYTSSFANNGQNMAGLSANTSFYNVTTALAMLAGRFGLGILALALAGALVKQRRRSETSGTLRTDTPLFAGLTVGTIVIVGGLTFFPVLALGPIFEALIMGG